MDFVAMAYLVTSGTSVKRRLRPKVWSWDGRVPLDAEFATLSALSGREEGKMRKFLGLALVSRFASILIMAGAWAAVGIAPTFAEEGEAAPFSGVIRVMPPGEVSLSTGLITRNQIVVSFPFEYLHTGVLLNDARGRGTFTRATLYARAGSPGYMVGRYGSAGRPIWCFFGSGELDVGAADCFWLIPEVDAAVVVEGLPYLSQGFRFNSQRHSQSNGLQIEQVPLMSATRHLAEYRFVGWRGRSVVLALHDSERRRQRFTIPPNEEGDVVLHTVAASLRFSQDERGLTSVALLD